MQTAVGSCGHVRAQATQMKYRMAEGSGECFYYLGEPLSQGCSPFEQPLGFSPAHRAICTSVEAAAVDPDSH